MIIIYLILISATTWSLERIHLSFSKAKLSNSNKTEAMSAEGWRVKNSAIYRTESVLGWREMRYWSFPLAAKKKKFTPTHPKEIGTQLFCCRLGSWCHVCFCYHSTGRLMGLVTRSCWTISVREQSRSYSARESEDVGGIAERTMGSTRPLARLQAVLGLGLTEHSWSQQSTHSRFYIEETGTSFMNRSMGIYFLSQNLNIPVQRRFLILDDQRDRIWWERYDAGLEYLPIYSIFWVADFIVV